MQEFLGVGMRFPIEVDAQGRLATSRYERDIEEAIRIVLFTAKGERLNRPGFGTRLNDFVFANINTHTLGAIQSEVSQALVAWEPRIRVLEVKVDPDETARDGLLRIGVDYRIRRSNTVYNKVFPFYLRPGG